jgi:hypothetical protein
MSSARQKFSKAAMRTVDPLPTECPDLSPIDFWLLVDIKVTSEGLFFQDINEAKDIRGPKNPDPPGFF